MTSWQVSSLRACSSTLRHVSPEHVKDLEASSERFEQQWRSAFDDYTSKCVDDDDYDDDYDDDDDSDDDDDDDGDDILMNGYDYSEDYEPTKLNLIVTPNNFK